MKINVLCYFFEHYAGYPSARHVHPTDLEMWENFKKQETKATRLSAIKEINWVLSQDQATKKGIKKQFNHACVHGIFHFKKNEQMVTFLEEMQQNLRVQSVDMLFFCTKKIAEKRMIELIGNYYGIRMASVEYPDNESSSFLMRTEYSGNYPVSFLVSFRVAWEKKINHIAFGLFVAQRENCTILLDHSQKPTYSLILPSQRIQEVNVEIENEHLIIQP